MPYNTKASKIQYVTQRNERIFAQHFVDAYTADIIDGTEKQYNRASAYVKFGADFASPLRQPVLLSSSDGMTTKQASSAFTTGLPHSPVKEVAASHKNLRELKTVVSCAVELAYRDYDDPRAYMATLTYPNADLGKLDRTYTNLDNAVNALFKSLSRGATDRMNGIVLPAQGGGVAKFLGAQLGYEITIKEKKLENEDGEGLFHPHTHTLNLFDRPLDMSVVVVSNHSKNADYYVPNSTYDDYIMPNAGAVLFSYFCSQHPRTKFSPEGFDFKACYAKEIELMKNSSINLPAPTKSDNANAINSAIAEGMKYETKPTSWSRLPDTPTDFTTEVFGELYNTLVHHKLKRSRGVFREMKSLIALARRHKFDEALLSAYFDDLGASTTTPNYFTDLAYFDGYTQHKLFDMNREQLLYFNRGLLNNSGFDASLFSRVKFSDSTKSQDFEYLLKRLTFVKPGWSGLLDNLNSKVTVQTDKVDRIKKSAFLIHAKYLEAEKNGMLTDKLKSDKSSIDDYLNRATSKLRDIERVRDAVEDTIPDVDNDNASLSLKNYSAIINGFDYVRLVDYITEKNNVEFPIQYWSMKPSVYQRMALSTLFGSGDKDDATLMRCPAYDLYSRRCYIEWTDSVIVEYKHNKWDFFKAVMNGKSMVFRDNVLTHFDDDYITPFVSPNSKCNTVDAVQELVDAIDQPATQSKKITEEDMGKNIDYDELIARITDDDVTDVA